MIQELLKTLILAVVLAFALFATFMPKEFGQWLQAIDHSRFAYYVCEDTPD